MESELHVQVRRLVISVEQLKGDLSRAEDKLTELECKFAETGKVTTDVVTSIQLEVERLNAIRTSSLQLEVESLTTIIQQHEHSVQIMMQDARWRDEQLREAIAKLVPRV
jgi:hypothetical protein